VTEVNAGFYHSMAIIGVTLNKGVVEKPSGTELDILSGKLVNIYSWGWGQHGQLGHGDHQDKLLPTRIEAILQCSLRVLALGATHSVAVMENGEVYSWGRGDYGQLGLGENREVLAPTILTALKGKIITCIGCGQYHNVAGTGTRETIIVPFSANTNAIITTPSEVVTK